MESFKTQRSIPSAFHEQVASSSLETSLSHIFLGKKKVGARLLTNQLSKTVKVETLWMTRRTFIYNPESNTSIKTPNQTKKSLLFVRERKSKKLNMKKEIQDFTLTQTHHKDIKSHIPRCQSIPLTPKSSTIFRYPKTPIEILKSKKLPKSSIIFIYPEFQKPKPL